MSDGGKGSTSRPLSISKQEYDERWDLIFNKNKKVMDDVDRQILKNEYYDILSTEDCLIDDEN